MHVIRHIARCVGQDPDIHLVAMPTIYGKLKDVPIFMIGCRGRMSGNIIIERRRVTGMLTQKQIRAIIVKINKADRNCFTDACKSGHRSRCWDCGHAIRGTTKAILFAVLEEDDYLDQYMDKKPKKVGEER